LEAASAFCHFACIFFAGGAVSVRYRPTAGGGWAQYYQPIL
jgi:hypothetical protein